ncbi:MAG: 1-(5-phosphoribosyl)-5-[(5-phosphoribosylamino)methylideneamino]imidazole-4-carboxamide isomerase [Candidatus Omnitrophica bacterium]|nr:1-(5-phosphoribosyl)-5-[(5-phosphoribosylamino)methylideneamino]imidazole-4-carboxamide isomerase [Candidatus Omnitrophota bacterium]MDD5487472.1 1-(5-phosphoribosyl)-5-[(5-phosphoribosylamino)methylideneamino]imidazole-4-carboxamide isomerase [Candidatus Omnitrophota bacterium]
MKIIPAIDLIAGKTVRLVQGDYGHQLDYAISPMEAARTWVEKGAETLHLIDLDGARMGWPVNARMVRSITLGTDVFVQTGGGYRTKDDIEFALEVGVGRVIIGSKALEDRVFAEECVKEFGNRVIFSLDVRAGRPSSSGWEKESKEDVMDILTWFKDIGVTEIIYTDIKSDGMLSGPDIDSLASLLDRSGLKIISAGGVKDIGHIKQLKALEKKGLSGVVIGRALYEGTIDLKEAINVGKEDNTLS